MLWPMCTCSNPQYFLGDALGSVRRLSDASGSLTLAQSFQPYGEGMNRSGSSAISFR
jgi:hypothetical protein